MAYFLTISHVLIGPAFANACGRCSGSDFSSATCLLQLRSGREDEAEKEPGGAEPALLEIDAEVPTCWTRQSALPPYDGGIFATCTGNDMRLCYHRHRYNDRELDRLSGGHETENVVIGEDPRIFEFKGKTYILDNYADDMHLIEIDAGSGVVLDRKRLFISAKKNVSPVVKGDKLYFVDFQEKKVFTASVRKHGVNAWGGQDINIIYEQSAACDDAPTRSLRSCFLRGGTPGVKVGNGFVGMGHCTRCTAWDPEDPGSCMGSKGQLTHTTFAWTTQDLKSIRVKPLCLQNSRNLADPTTLWTNPWRLVTAESDDQWMGGSQTYSTVMYQPCGENPEQNADVTSVSNDPPNPDTTIGETAAGLENHRDTLTNLLQERYEELQTVANKQIALE